MRPQTSTLMLCGVLVAAVVSTRWYRVNISPSVAYGFYRLVAVPTPIARGMLVVLPAPVSVRPWWAAWVPLLKPIAGLAGDRVCHQENVLYVNGADFGPVLQTAHGRPLPQLQGCLVVQAGEVFLASPVVHSLDSRYFGGVSVTDLTAVALPIFTWR